MIEIRTLGQTKVSVDGEELAGEAAWPKSLALIVFMAREPGPDRREDVLSILWPERDEKRARRALNQLLYTLRKASPQLDLESVSGALDFGRDVWLDVDEFERRLAAGDLEGAIELYGGPFLADLDFDEPEFQHWADGQRAGLRRRFRKAALQLAQESKSAGDYEGAVRYCRRLLDADPLDDEVQHLLIECLYRLGNRLAALRQFEKYRDLLKQELDVEPLEPTLELVERIKAEPVAGADRSTGGIDLPWTTPVPKEEEEEEEVEPTAGAEPPPDPSPAAAAPIAEARPGRRGLLTAAAIFVAATAVVVAVVFWPESAALDPGGGSSLSSGPVADGAGQVAHRVVISLSAGGDALEIDPAELTVRPGERIIFVGAGVDELEVDLGVEGPGRTHLLTSTGGDSAETVVRLTAAAGRYGYTAAARIGGRVVVARSEIVVRGAADGME